MHKLQGLQPLLLAMSAVMGLASSLSRTRQSLENLPLFSICGGCPSSASRAILTREAPHLSQLYPRRIPSDTPESGKYKEDVDRKSSGYNGCSIVHRLSEASHFAWGMVPNQFYRNCLCLKSVSHHTSDKAFKMFCNSSEHPIVRGIHASVSYSATC